MIPSARKKLLVLLYLLFLLSCSSTLASDEAIIKRVVDGDTVVVVYQGREEKIRMIGVDTPETVDPRKPVEYFGREASAFTKKLLPPGIRVRLEFDWEKRDKYGRMLAYVYKGGMFVNAEIIKQGYGHAYTRFPFRYLEDFRRYEREAREAGRGLWGGSGIGRTETRGTPARPARQGKIIGNKKSMIYHVPGGQSYDKVAPENRVYFDTEEEAQRAGYRRAKR